VGGGIRLERAVAAGLQVLQPQALALGERLRTTNGIGHGDLLAWR